MDTTKLRRAASWLTFTGVNAALLEVADLLDRLPEPGTCPRCEANAELHRRCPEHAPPSPSPRCNHCGDLCRWSGDAPLPEPLTVSTAGLVEHDCGYEGAPSPRYTFTCPVCVRPQGSETEDGLCIFCGQDTWDGGRHLCTDPECELFQPEEDTAGKDHPHCHKHGEPQPCNVCRARDAEREVQRLTSEAKEWKHAAENINVEVAGYVGQRDAALAEVERLTVVIQDILYKKDWLEEQLDTIRDAREKARVMDDKPWVALEHLEQAIDRLGEGESKGEGGGATAAQEPGAAGPAETGACAAEAPSPKLGLRQHVGELLAGALPGLSGVPEAGVREVCRLIDAHLAEDAARETRHRKVRVWAERVLLEMPLLDVYGHPIEVLAGLRAALEEDSDG